MNFNNHLVMQHCSSAAQYFAMAFASRGLDDYNIHTDTWRDHGMEAFRLAADAMGFDLVKREDAAPKLEAAE